MSHPLGVIPEPHLAVIAEPQSVIPEPHFGDSRATVGDTGATFRDSGATDYTLRPAKTAGFSRPNLSNLRNYNNKGAVLLPFRFAREAIN